MRSFDLFPGHLTLSSLRDATQMAFDLTPADSSFGRAYLAEAYYYLPLLLGSRLHRNDEYDRALECYRAVYDYLSPEEDHRRKIDAGLARDDDRLVRERQADWLLDPLNVHKIVGSRKNADTRYAQISIVRCLLEYADTEFATDTSESVARARRLYRQALRSSTRPNSDGVPTRVKLTTTLETLVASATVHTVSSDRPWWPLLEELLQRVREFDEYQQRLVVVEEVRNILTTPEPLEDDELSGRPLSALKVVDDHERPATDGQVMSDVIDERTVAMPEPYAALLADDWTVRNTESISKISADRQIGAHVGMSHSSVFHRQRGVLQTIVSLPYQFCVPRNPILAALRERAESNLRKIRDCRNFAGIRRQLEPYAVPTGVENGLPKFSDDELSLLGTRSMQPTPYRYSTLISRAKELANLAHQFEESFLAKLERLYAEEYTLLNARQDVERSRTNVELQGLRMSQAQEEVSLAELQRDRAQVTLDHYKNLFDNGLLPSESASLRGAHIGVIQSPVEFIFGVFGRFGSCLFVLVCGCHAGELSAAPARMGPSAEPRQSGCRNWRSADRYCSHPSGHRPARIRYRRDPVRPRGRYGRVSTKSSPILSCTSG